MVSKISSCFAESDIKSQIPKHILNQKRTNYLTLSVENDLFGSGRDSNYTSGILLTYLDAGNDASLKWLQPLLPFYTFNETTSSVYYFGQSMFTPDDITIPTPQYENRPWAAFLYGSAGATTLVGNHINDLNITLGMIGPWAQGERAQKFVHSIIGSPTPLGWSNQLNNEPGLILSYRRRWPVQLVENHHNLSLSIDYNLGTSIGNVYTLADTGFTFRVSPASERWQDSPMLVPPSMPGTGYFYSQSGQLGWYLFAGLQGRVVARNIFLDGNTYSNSYSISKKPLVMDAVGGISINYSDFRLAYTAIYRTKEFDMQMENTFFGSISVSYRC
tara:strand:- start:91 stop:1083 length:993 start_codon:yes stop_codon:yes gene_type:complete